MHLQALGTLTIPQIQSIEELAVRCTLFDGNSVPVYRHLLEYERPFPCNILAYADHKLIGFSRAFFFAENEVELSMMIDPAYRRQGIATSMFKQLLPVIQSQYVQKLNITAPDGLHAAWLKRLDFNQTGTQYQMRHQPQHAQTPVNLTANQIIRLATAEDLPYLTAIHRAGFPKESSEIQEYLQMLVNDSQHRIFILVSSGLPVGKAHVRFQGNSAYLADIAVFPKHQGKGYARALIQHCLKTLEKTHAYNIFLDLEDDNERAQKIYLDLGFLVVNTHQCWSAPINFQEFNLTDFLQRP